MAMSQAHRGLGHAMVQFILDEARKQGCKAVRLDTGAQNIPARPLVQYHNAFGSQRKKPQILREK